MTNTPSYSPVIDTAGISHENLLEDSDPISNPFYYAQDRQGWYDEVATKACEQRSKQKAVEIVKKKKKSKCVKNASFIVRKEPGHVRHLIQIMMYDLDGHNIEELNIEPGNASVNVQYLVTSQYDDILDETEHLVCKVVKKLSKSGI